MISRTLISSLIFFASLFRQPATLPSFFEKTPTHPGYSVSESLHPLNQPGTITVSNVNITYRFLEWAAVSAQIQNAESAKKSYIFVQPRGQAVRVIPFTPSPAGLTEIRLDLKTTPLPSFSRIDYWFRFENDGGEYTSDKYWFDYTDNRFPWSSLENQSISSFWQTGELEFGQAILNSAQKSLAGDHTLFPAAIPSPLKIYVYSNPTDLQSALASSPPSWINGHASPELGVVLISISPGPQQNIELERQIPHEITHILQFQTLGKNTQRMPAWFLEGSASLAEIYPNPEYQDLLSKAQKNNSFLPMQSLCSSFPPEAGNALLAYAQSAFFVKHLQQDFGNNKILQMVNKYTDGMGCEEGFAAAFGISLADYEKRWQAQIGESSLLASTNTSNPVPYYLIFFFLVMIPVISTLISGKSTFNPEGKTK